MNHSHLYPRVSLTGFTVKPAGGPQDKILPLPSTVPEGPEGRNLHSRLKGKSKIDNFLSKILTVEVMD